MKICKQTNISKIDSLIYDYKGIKYKTVEKHIDSNIGCELGRVAEAVIMCRPENCPIYDQCGSNIRYYVWKRYN